MPRAPDYSDSFSNIPKMGALEAPVGGDRNRAPGILTLTWIEFSVSFILVALLIKINWISQPFCIMAIATGKISVAFLILRILAVTHLETTNSLLCYLQRTPLRYGQHYSHIHAVHTYESLVDAFSNVPCNSYIVASRTRQIYPAIVASSILYAFLPQSLPSYLVLFILSGGRLRGQFEQIQSEKGFRGCLVLWCGPGSHRELRLSPNESPSPSHVKVSQEISVFRNSPPQRCAKVAPEQIYNHEFPRSFYSATPEHNSLGSSGPTLSQPEKHLLWAR